MNTPRNTPSGDTSRSSEASGQHEGLRHPVTDDQRVQQRLDDAGLEDQGEAVENELRDRGSSGAAPGQLEEGTGSQETRRH